jgi:hypothetical protein
MAGRGRGKPIQKGQVLNPRGANAHSKDTKIMRQVTAATYKEVADLILEGNVEGLKSIVSNPASSVMRIWIAKAAATAIQKGDLGPLEQILNRAIGKPKENVEHSGGMSIEMCLKRYEDKP